MSMASPLVVLVDDDASARRAYRDYLRTVVGFDVHDFATAEDALTYIQAHAHRCTAVLLDLVLEPGGLSGQHFFEVLRHDYPLLPVVIFSGMDRRGGIDALTQGAFASLQKPLDLKELEAIIRDIAGREAIFQQMADDVQRLLGADVSIMWRLDRRDHCFRVAGWSGNLDVDYRLKMTLDADDQSWQRFLKRGEPRFLYDVTDPHQVSPYRHREAATKRGWRSLYTVPLAYEGRVICLVDSYFYTVREPDPFLNQALHAFAHQATAAVRFTILSQQARLLHEINQALADTLEEEAVLQPILAKAVEAMGADHGYLYLTEADSPAPVCRHKVSQQTQAIDDCLEIAESIAGYVARSGLVQIETGRRPLPFSIAAIPLRRSERTTGVLALKSSNPDYFNTDDVSLLQSLAAIAAVAIERSKLAHHLQEVSLLALTATRYVDLAAYVVRAVRDLTGADVALWMMSSYEPSPRRCLRIDASAGHFSQEFIDQVRLPVEPDASLNAQALHSGAPVVCPDLQLVPNQNHRDMVVAHGWHSFMAVPLFGREKEHLGVLSLYDKETDKFRKPDEQLVETFANQAAVAFQQHRRIAAMQMLAEVGQTLAMSLTEARHLLLQVAEIAREITGADCTVIYPYDPKRKLFYSQESVTAVGLKHELELKKVTSKPRVFGLAAFLREQRIVVVDDIDQERMRVGSNYAVEEQDEQYLHHMDKLRSSNFISREEIKAFVGISLLAHKTDGQEDNESYEEVGVLYFNFRAPHWFSTEELQIIQIFAQHVANVIHSARLYEETRNLAATNANLLKKERVLREVNSAISANLALPEVISQILDGLRQVVPYDKATIQLIDGENRSLLAFHGWDESAQTNEWFLRPISEDRLVSRIVQKQEPVILSHPRRSADWEVRDGTANVGSWVGLPLVSNGEVIGLLTLDHRQPGFYSKYRDRDNLVLFANHAAVAIQNSRLYSQMEKLVEARTRALEIEKIRTIATEKKLAISGRIAAQFVHHFNNLGATIPVRVNLAMENLNPYDVKQAKVMEELQLIGVELKDLLQVADEIRHSTETRSAEMVDVNDLITIALEQVKRSIRTDTNTVSVAIRLSDGLPSIMIDRSRLLEVFANIIRNAYDAMPTGGTLSVTSCLICNEKINYISVTVSDTGIGIPSRDLPRIFDLFFTTKKTGWGFGLWHDKTFLNELGGDVNVESTQGKGSKFSISIPVSMSGKAARSV